MNPVVPFPFDVHFKIHSEDALDTLKRLHGRFQARRVNLLNDRRDFFQVSIDEIAQAIDEINKQTGVLNILKSERNAQAFEYQRTFAERNKILGSATSNTHDRKLTA
jgi:phosphopantetheine adenylyltransferase